MVLASYNKRVSGYALLRPNPRYARTSDTRKPLGDMSRSHLKKEA